MLPLLAPISATVGIFAFPQSWNDFQMPNLITANPKFQTLPVVQYLFQDQFTTNINVAFASYLMALIPTRFCRHQRRMVAAGRALPDLPAQLR